MKKVIFFACIAIATSFSVSAQSKAKPALVPQKKVHPVTITYPMPQATTIPYDSTTRFTQQFLKDWDGITYRIVLNEFPYNGRRNEMLVYKMDRDMPAIEYMFKIAPSVKNFRVLVSDDNKKLVALYDYNGEVKVIEFK